MVMFIFFAFDQNVFQKINIFVEAKSNLDQKFKFDNLS